MNAVLLDFPDHLESERLHIRCPQLGDGQAIYEAIVESLDDLKPWMPWALEEQSVSHSETFARRAQAQWLVRENLILLLFRKSDGLFVGGSGLHRLNWEVRKFEIGYWCRTTLARHGYIGEGTAAITQFAFDTLGARRVEIRVNDQNMRSWRIPQRLGFQLEGILRQDALEAGGQLRDTRIYAKTR